MKLGGDSLPIGRRVKTRVNVVINPHGDTDDVHPLVRGEGAAGVG